MFTGVTSLFFHGRNIFRDTTWLARVWKILDVVLCPKVTHGKIDGNRGRLKGITPETREDIIRRKKNTPPSPLAIICTYYHIEQPFTSSALSLYIFHGTVREIYGAVH